MAEVTVLTAARMLAMEAASIVDAAIEGGELIFTTHGGDSINAGPITGGLTEAQVRAIVQEEILASGGVGGPGAEPATVTPYINDIFSTDSSAQYDACLATSKTGMTFGSGGVMVSDTNDHKVHSGSYVTGTNVGVTLEWEQATGATNEQMSAMLKWVDNDNWVSIDYDRSSYAGGWLNECVDGTVTSIGSLVFDPATLTDYGTYTFDIRLWNNKIRARFLNGDLATGTVVETLNYDLDAPAIAAYGSAVPGSPGFGIRNQGKITRFRYTELT